MTREAASTAAEYEWPMLLNESCKPLPQAELFALIERAQGGDAAARNRVIASTMKMVIKHADDRARRLDLMNLRDDMVTAACCGYKGGGGGLMRAVALFDTKRGYRWTTYALRWITVEVQAVITAALQNGMGRATAERLAHIRATASKLADRLGREPTPAEIQGDYRARGKRVPVADRIDRALGGSYVPEGTPEESEDSAHDALEGKRQSAELSAAIDELGEQERHVVRLALRDMSLAEIGRSMGLSRERARVIYAGAVERLREVLT